MLKRLSDQPQQPQQQQQQEAPPPNGPRGINSLFPARIQPGRIMALDPPLNLTQLDLSESIWWSASD